MPQGEIYVLVNGSMPGLVKVGKTNRSAQERSQELSQATGVPTPFILVFHQHFPDVDNAENAVHARLEALGARVSSSREFFRIPPNDVIRLIIEVFSKEANRPNFTRDFEVDHKDSTSDLIDNLIDEGMDFEYGNDSLIPDHARAEDCYRQAMRLGSVKAIRYLGDLYSDEDSPKFNLKKAEEMFTKAANQGDILSLGKLASILVIEKMYERSVQIWVRYLQASSALDPKTASQPLSMLVMGCYYKNLPMKLLNLIYPYKAYIIANLERHKLAFENDDDRGIYESINAQIRMVDGL